MLIDKSLIEKFMENRCNAEEAKQVHSYLSDHPEVLQEYYQRDWDVTDNEEPLHSVHSAKMLRIISSRTYERKMVTLRYLPWVAAAAVVIIAFGVWLFLSPGKQAIVPVAVNKVTIPEKPAQPTYNWQQQYNATRKPMRMKLPDGSVATLSPAALIRFRQPFEQNKRDLFLEGEALFEVVKDKTKPFTVYSGMLSTTALGTSFRVIASPALVNVQLLTGKVVIKSVKQQLPGWKEDVFLLPGQQMKYDAVANVVKVIGSGAVTHAVQELAEVRSASQEFVFNNTPVQDVLEKLMLHYKVSISYKPEELHDLHFSGTIFYNDSLPAILQVIGRMNDLSVTTISDGFCLRRVSKE